MSKAPLSEATLRRISQRRKSKQSIVMNKYLPNAAIRV
jgi:hypothetical protein